MRKDNDQLSDVLQHEYEKKTDYFTHTEVPENAVFEIDGYQLKIKYSIDLILKPLNNIDSFEGWVLICHRWGIFDRICFDWAVPDDVESKEYQDFLFRVTHFNKVFKKWFEISKSGLKHLKALTSDKSICDRLILESIIEIAWHFETGEKIKIKIPDKWNIRFDKGFVEINAAEGKESENSINSGESQVYTPWQLLINRWAYLPTRPKAIGQELTPWDDMTPEIKKLIKVGFAERNFPFPAEY